MRHLVVEDLHKFSLKEAPEPTIQCPTDVIVKVTATTICGSDAHIILGEIQIPWGFPLGHEFVGTIHELGSEVQSLKLGDRVAASPGVWCNHSESSVMEQRLVIWGGAQAEYVRVPCAENTLSLIPNGVSDAQALAVGDMLCTGWTGVERAAINPGATLVVFGAGPVGLCTIHTARLQKVDKIIAIDVIADRLDVAKTLGADHTINPTLEDVGDTVMKLTNGRGAEAIVDAAGAQSSINCWGSVAALGAKISMTAVPSGPVEVPLAQLQLKSVTLWTGLADPTRSRRDTLLQAIKDGALDPSAIFTETVQFDQIETALNEFMSRKKGLIKPLIVFS
ncbi:Polyketide synthase enoylreductase [Penicillium citrinum]|uniref:Polyketide synthase enoylreductase n=1 Tax=Penicillium citrinum TaxID=5077 RepID=A0A9W9NKN4_PENCI|nr:Polyketide synthase enoylreductase [Penicillium citrinum]KAJ5221727.1 Polyketide synthase enoylreductase [Penicillium citrinum]